mgnify:CR=1 FL=1
MASGLSALSPGHTEPAPPVQNPPAAPSAPPAPHIGETYAAFFARTGEADHALFTLVRDHGGQLADPGERLAFLQQQLEPLSALASGADGLDDIRRIAAQALEHLQPGGWLLLEHGWDQASAVARLLGEQGYASIEHRLDLAGHLRCTGGRRAAR